MTASTVIKWPNVAGVDFRGVVGAPGYCVGSDGSLWTCWQQRGRGHGMPPEWFMSDAWFQLTPQPRQEDGRKRYTVRTATGRYRRAYCSHFVLEAFVGPRPDGMEACHGDGNCLNDALSNLRWDTPIANKADMKRHGTQVAGATHPKAKLTDAQIEGVLHLRSQGESFAAIGKTYGVSAARAHQICKKGAR